MVLIFYKKAQNIYDIYYLYSNATETNHIKKIFDLPLSGIANAEVKYVFYSNIIQNIMNQNYEITLYKYHISVELKTITQNLYSSKT